MHVRVRMRSTAAAGLPLLALPGVPVMMNAGHDQFLRLAVAGERASYAGPARPRRITCSATAPPCGAA